MFGRQGRQERHGRVWGCLRVVRRSTGGRLCSVCSMGLLVRRGSGRGFEKENLDFWLMGVVLISVRATRTLSHPTASLACFTVLQCVLLLGLAHLPRHLPPLWSAAFFPADLTISLLPHPPPAPSATPNSACLSAAGPLPLPRTHPLAGARDFSC